MAAVVSASRRVLLPPSCTRSGGWPAQPASWASGGVSDGAAHLQIDVGVVCQILGEIIEVARSCPDLRLGLDRPERRTHSDTEPATTKVNSVADNHERNFTQNRLIDKDAELFVAVKGG